MALFIFMLWVSSAAICGWGNFPKFFFREKIWIVGEFDFISFRSEKKILRNVLSCRPLRHLQGLLVIKFVCLKKSFWVYLSVPKANVETSKENLGETNRKVLINYFNKTQHSNVQSYFHDFITYLRGTNKKQSKVLLSNRMLLNYVSEKRNVECMIVPLLCIHILWGEEICFFRYCTIINNLNTCLLFCGKKKFSRQRNCFRWSLFEI